MKILTAFAIFLDITLALAGCGGGSPYSSVKVGDTIHFGGFNWLVLTVENGKALILSEKSCSKGHTCNAPGVFSVI